MPGYDTYKYFILLIHAFFFSKYDKNSITNACSGVDMIIITAGTSEFIIHIKNNIEFSLLY